MSLADFITRKADAIVDESERFARTVASLRTERDVSTLRDHLPLVLKAIALDLEQPQSQFEQRRKSEGLGPTLPGETAAQVHGRLRADSGLSIEEVVAEYRVLRAAVLQLWDGAGGFKEPNATRDMMRFNEAIDQAIAESVLVYSAKIDHWRQTLLAVIGHDLRSPLQVLKMTTEALRRHKGGPLETYISRLSNGVDHLSQLLDALLDYNKAKLGAAMLLQRRPTDAADVCRQEVETLRVSLPQVQINFEAAGETTGRFDALRLREALSNLVSNAHQYRHPGTEISVRVKGDAEFVVLSVGNEGPAIAPEVLAKLFEPFQRNRDGEYAAGHRNLGLGLFVVREIARAHDGDVDVASSGGRIVFEVRLRKAESRPAEIGAA